MGNALIPRKDEIVVGARAPWEEPSVEVGARAPWEAEAQAMPQPEPPEQATGVGSSFTGGVKRGIDQTQALLGGAAGLIGTGLEIEGLESWGQETYRENMREAQRYVPKEGAATFAESDSAEDYANWAAGTLGELVPTMAVSMAGGGVGGLVGKAILGNTVKGLAAKGLAQKAVAGQIVGTEAKRALKRAALPAVAGQIAGAASATTALESGGIYGTQVFGEDLTEQNEPDAGLALLYGIPAGMLDAIVPAKLLGKLGIGRGAGQAATDALGDRKKREALAGALRGALTTAPMEGLTEVGQGILERAAQMDYEGILDTPEGLDQVFDSEASLEEFMAGLLGGGVAGGAAGALQGRRQAAAKEGRERTLMGEMEGRKKLEVARERAVAEAAEAEAEQKAQVQKAAEARQQTIDQTKEGTLRSIRTAPERQQAIDQAFPQEPETTGRRDRDSDPFRPTLPPVALTGIRAEEDAGEDITLAGPVPEPSVIVDEFGIPEATTIPPVPLTPQQLVEETERGVALELAKQEQDAQVRLEQIRQEDRIERERKQADLRQQVEQGRTDVERIAGEAQPVPNALMETPEMLGLRNKLQDARITGEIAENQRLTRELGAGEPQLRPLGAESTQLMGEQDVRTIPGDQIREGAKKADEKGVTEEQAERLQEESPFAGMASVADVAPEKRTVAQAEQRLSQGLGAGTVRRAKRDGFLKVLSAEEWAQQPEFDGNAKKAAGVNGLFRSKGNNGQPQILVRATATEDVLAIALHEGGEHAGMGETGKAEGILGASYGAIQNQLERMFRAGDERALDADKRAQESVKFWREKQEGVPDPAKEQGIYQQERLAYFIQGAQLRENEKATGALKRVLDSVRAWWRTTETGKAWAQRGTKELTDGMALALAKRAFKVEVAKAGMGPGPKGGGQQAMASRAGAGTGEQLSGQSLREAENVFASVSTNYSEGLDSLIEKSGGDMKAVSKRLETAVIHPATKRVSHKKGALHFATHDDLGNFPFNELVDGFYDPETKVFLNREEALKIVRGELAVDPLPIKMYDEMGKLESQVLRRRQAVSAESVAPGIEVGMASVVSQEGRWQNPAALPEGTLQWASRPGKVWVATVGNRPIATIRRNVNAKKWVVGMPGFLWVREPGAKIAPQVKESSYKAFDKREEAQRAIETVWASRHATDSAKAGMASVAEPGPQWHSQVGRTVAGAKQEKAQGAQWLGWLKKQKGVKQEEIEDLGLAEWLGEKKGAVTKGEVQEFVEQGGVRIEEKLKQNLPQIEQQYIAIKRYVQAGSHELTLDEGPNGNVEVTSAGGTVIAKGTPDEVVRTLGITDDQPIGTKFTQFQEPGGENYRELLLTLPPERHTKADTYSVTEHPEGSRQYWAQNDRTELLMPPSRETFELAQRRADTLTREHAASAYRGIKEPEKAFTSQHYPDEPNILAHIRFNERIDADGKKVLFVEEVQSDWHQQGRKEGYKDSAAEKKARSEYDLLAEERKQVSERLTQLREKMESAAGADGTDFRSMYKLARGPHSHRMGIVGAKLGIDEAVELSSAYKRLTQEMNAVVFPDSAVPDAPFKTSWPLLAMKRAIRWGAENGFDKVAWKGDPQMLKSSGGWTDLAQNAEGKWIANGDQNVTAIVNRYMEDLPRGMAKYLKKQGMDARVKKETMPVGETWAIDLSPKVAQSVLDQGQAMYSVAQEGTPEFKEWFGDSKVVDGNGEPLVVYHGTKKDFDSFSKEFVGTNTGNPGLHGTGVGYFAEHPDDAGSYAGYEEGSNVIPVYLSMEKPFRFTDLEREAENAGDLVDSAEYQKELDEKADKEWPIFEEAILAQDWTQKQKRNAITKARVGWGEGPVFPVRAAIKAATGREITLDEAAVETSAFLSNAGFDGIIVEVDGEQVELVAFEPTQIKSATGNVGAFDPNDPSILASLGMSASAPLYAIPPSTEQSADLNAAIKAKPTVMKRVKDVLRRGWAPGGHLSGYAKGAHDEIIGRDASQQNQDAIAERLVHDLERAVKDATGVNLRDQDEAFNANIDSALKGSDTALRSLPAKAQDVIGAMRKYLDNFSREYAEAIAESANQGMRAWEVAQQKVAELKAELTALPKGEERDALRKTLQQRTSEMNKLEKKAIDQAGLVGIIRGNMGKWVNRSFRVFDDKKWHENVSPDTLDAARAFLQKEENMTEQEAQVYMMGMLKDMTAFDTFEDWIKEGKAGMLDLRVLRKKKDIPEPLLALLGEYKDPRVNFAKSAAKVTRLVFNTRLLQRLEKVGRQQGWLADRTNLARDPDMTHTIQGGKGYEPLAGMKTYPEVEQGLKDILGKQSWPPWLENIVQVTSFVKRMKTIYSPAPTGIRNYVSSPMALIANADLNWRGLNEAVGAWEEYILNKDLGQQRAHLEHIAVLGVSYDTPFAGELQDLEKDTKLKDALLAEGAPSGRKGLGLAMYRMGQNFNRAMTRGYQFGDDFVKITAFRSKYGNLEKYVGARTREQYESETGSDQTEWENSTIGDVKLKQDEDGSWAFRDQFGNNIVEGGKSWETQGDASADAVDVLTKWHIEKMAAERIRNTYQTYSLVGRTPRFLRKFPLTGTFVSFPVEMIRTVSNMVRYIQQDLKDPDLRPMAIRQMVGMSLVASMAYGAEEWARAALGVDDEELDAARESSAPWNQLSNMVPVGRNERGDLQLMDFGYVDLYAMWHTLPNALMSGQPLDEALQKAAAQLASPFVGVDITAGAVNELLNNRKSGGGQIWLPESDTPPQQAWKIAKHMLKTVAPSTLVQGEKILRASQGVTTSWGEKLDVEKELKALGGWKVQTVDPARMLNYGQMDFNMRKKDTTYGLGKTVGDPNDVGQKELKGAVQQALKARAENYERMIRKVKAAKKLGMTTTQMRIQLRKFGLSRLDVIALVNERVPPWRPGLKLFARKVEKARLLFKDTPEKWREIEARRRDVLRMIRVGS